MQTVSNIGGAVTLQVAQGTTFGPVALTFTNPDGTPVNLTGAALAMEIRKTPSTPVLASATLIITNAAAGLAAMTLPDSVTSALQAGPNLGDPASQYVWDLKLTDASGYVSRPMYGPMQIWREVTS